MNSAFVCDTAATLTSPRVTSKPSNLDLTQYTKVYVTFTMSVVTAECDTHSTASGINWRTVLMRKERILWHGGARICLEGKKH